MRIKISASPIFPIVTQTFWPPADGFGSLINLLTLFVGDTTITLIEDRRMLGSRRFEIRNSGGIPRQHGKEGDEL